MLLAELTSSLQNQYAQIQEQIEALQEQQRLIQAQLQRVGSVESKMESAAALIQEAIAEINEVCPLELENYQTTIDSLFTTTAAQLPPVDDSDFVDPEESLEVGDYFDGENGNGNGTINLEDLDYSNNFRDYPDPDLDEEENGNGNGHLSLDDLNQLSIQKIRKLASAKEVSCKGKRWEIAQRLEGLVSEDDVAALK